MRLVMISKTGEILAPLEPLDHYDRVLIEQTGSSVEINARDVTGVSQVIDADDIRVIQIVNDYVE